MSRHVRPLLFCLPILNACGGGDDTVIFDVPDVLPTGDVAVLEDTSADLVGNDERPYDVESDPGSADDGFDDVAGGDLVEDALGDVEVVDTIVIYDVSEDPGPTDAGPQPDCVESSFDWECDPQDATTCPQGFCVLGFCIAAEPDPFKWSHCGDYTCGDCETAENCPADCGELPEIAGPKQYDSAETITVWLHGFYNKDSEEMGKMVYGEDRGCGGVQGDLKLFGIDLPCGESDATASVNQFSRVEYYGGTPADWMTNDDMWDIEKYPYDGAAALERYARIAARFIRHKLDVTGAKWVNLTCHSMGCYVTRFIIEHDLQDLASEGRFVRWITSAGVIAGARLARLYDNPQVQSAGAAIGLELSDFIILNPDFTRDFVAVWDHKINQGNSPYLKNTLIHHVGGTDPYLEEALNIPLLDLNNTTNEPNDGIMYTSDEFFHSQKESGAFTLPDKTMAEATHSYVYEYHMAVPDTQTYTMMAAAGLFSRRKVEITLESIHLLKDRESHGLFDGENGQSPAEVSMEVEVKYNPYVSETFGLDVLAHQSLIDQRTPSVFSMNQGTTAYPGTVVFEGPVFDEMTELYLNLKALEVDWYPRYLVNEWQFDAHESLASFSGQVALTNGIVDFETEYARCRLAVKVTDMY